MNIMEMYTQGVSVAEIARLTGNREPVVRAELRSKGIHFRSRPMVNAYAWEQRKRNEAKREQLNGL